MNYRDVTLTGLGLPQEVSVGLAWQVTDAWQLGAKIMSSDWSRAMRS